MGEKAIEFALIGIKTEQFVVFEENFEPKKKVELAGGFSFKIKRKEKQLGVFVTFQFDQNKQAFIKLEVSCHFSIKEEAWNKFITEDQIIFPEGFVQHLCMLSVGTARGILHAKTEGTMFNSFLLPTMNITNFVRSELKFEINKEDNNG